ncbi:uncharacterized protein LOC117693636 isoform X3 [Arvicanthis niloticus]|uniref:uncharacterized protein LOC117693636 isoform X3 n=1 Tax=Arvicanthis niloticus TaxID=61156 RepID=UPI00402B9D93
MPVYFETLLGVHDYTLHSDKSIGICSIFSMGNCCDTRVLPRNTIPTPSSRVEEGSPKSSIKVEPKKDQHATHVLRQSHHRNIAAPLHADEHQLRACTSRDNLQAEATALTKHTDNATSDEDQKKRPLRKVKVPIKKNRHVLPECADNTLDKGKAHLKVAKVESKRCKCLSSILKKFSRKKTVAPLVVKRPQVLPGAFTETAQITTEVLPENADAAPSAGGQGEPPVGMAKEERKKRRHIFSLLRGICQKTSVTTQDTKRPSASEGPLTKTTEIKTQDIPENTDAPDDQKSTPETMESVEARRRRRISELLKRIEQKQATAFQDVMGPEVCKVSSAETAVQNKKENATAPSPVDEEKTSESSVQVEPTRFKCFFSLLQRFSKKDPHPSQAWAEPPGPPSTSKETSANEKGMQNVPDIKELFFKKEEFEPHDEGSWEEYQSYFPHGVHVPDSRQTMASTMVESYVAQVGDTDVEEQEQLDSKENFPAVNTLFVHRPGSSESDEESTPIRRKKRRYKRRL